MSGVLCLKWNNHTSTFLQNFEYLRCKELYCDATLACFGKYYPVHRFVLTTCSEHFEDIFARTPCKHPFIILNDIVPIQLEALLQYMYKGEVNVLQEDLPGLIKAAEALKVKGLAVHEDDTDSQKFRGNKHSNSNHVNKEKDEEISEFSLDSQDKTVCNEKEQEKIDTSNRVSTPPFENSVNGGDTNKRNHFKNLNNGLREENGYTSEKINALKENQQNNECIKEEEFDEDKLDKVSHIGTEEDPSAFLSLLNSEKELHNHDHMNGFPIPQCSTWSDALQNQDTVNKENLESPWLHSAEYESAFPLDPIHYLSTGTSNSPSYSSFGLNDSSSMTFKDETNQSKANSSTVNGKKHKYQCNECAFSTNDKAAFRLHIMRKHTGEKPFACSLCTYRCTTKDMLKIHTRKHTGEKPFSCPYCSCRMAVKSSLKRHILLKHIQNRKPKSQTISDSCITAGTLKTYKCNFCSYESQMKSNLKLHCMRIHTGEKPIACSLCPYRTTTKPQLEKHMRKHTGEKPFACTFCTYKAAQKHSLLRHMALHTK